MTPGLSIAVNLKQNDPSLSSVLKEIDEKEAKNLGKKAYSYSEKNNYSFSVSMVERKNFNQKYSVSIGINKLSDVAAKTKLMPKNFINSKENHVTNKFINYHFRRLI